MIDLERYYKLYKRVEAGESLDSFTTEELTYLKDMKELFKKSILKEIRNRKLKKLNSI